MLVGVLVGVFVGVGEVPTVAVGVGVTSLNDVQ